MQPATIRRLLVFGVCLAGVGGLYLMPSTAGSPAGRGSPGQRDLPASPPSVATVVSVATPMLEPGSFGTVAATPAARFPSTTDRRAGMPGADRPVSRPMATAGRPGRDQNPPGAVGPLSVTRVDADRLTVTWPTATDDVGVVSYKVWLNGFVVVTTQQQRASLPWFNDSSTHVVQVRALDAVGNEGPSSPTLLVVRPSPSPAATTSSHAPSTSAPTADTHRSSDTDQEESS
ncbi:MAG TPA: hypothetical protein VIT65_08240 [Microlunatus sp.]